MRYFGLAIAEGEPTFVVRVLDDGETAQVLTGCRWLDDDDAWLMVAEGSLPELAPNLVSQVTT